MFQMGTVCNDLFDDVAGTIICKEMGKNCLKSFTSRNALSITSNVSMPILLDDVACVLEAGIEPSFEANCEYKFTHNCQHGEDIFLQCGT